MPEAKIDPNVNRGPSDFDVRHLFSGALTYDIPPPDPKALSVFLSNWSTLDSIGFEVTVLMHGGSFNFLTA